EADVEADVEAPGRGGEDGGVVQRQQRVVVAVAVLDVNRLGSAGRWIAAVDRHRPSADDAGGPGRRGRHARCVALEVIAEEEPGARAAVGRAAAGADRAPRSRAPGADRAPRRPAPTAGRAGRAPGPAPAVPRAARRRAARRRAARRRAARAARRRAATSVAGAGAAEENRQAGDQGERGGAAQRGCEGLHRFSAACPATRRRRSASYTPLADAGRARSRPAGTTATTPARRWPPP